MNSIAKEVFDKLKKLSEQKATNVVIDPNITAGELRIFLEEADLLRMETILAEKGFTL